MSNLVGKRFPRRDGKKTVTIIGDISLSEEGKGTQYVLICSDGYNRLANGRYLNDDSNHPWDLLLT